VRIKEEDFKKWIKGKTISGTIRQQRVVSPYHPHGMQTQLWIKPDDS